MKIVGIQEFEGEYKGFPFHTFAIHCEYESDNCIGKATVSYKIKQKNIPDIFDVDNMTPADWEELIGREVKIFADQYKQIQFIKFLDINQ